MNKLIIFFSLCSSVTLVNAQQWEEIGPFPGGARDDGVAFSVQGVGIAGSGRDAGFNYRKDFYKFDPSNESWSQIPDIPGEPRQYAGRFVIADTGYVVCGVSPNNYLKEVWGYCPSTNEWDQKASLPADGRASPVAFAVEGKGYCGTGRNDDGYLKDLWEYNPLTDSWEQLDDFLGLARFEAFGISLGNQAYMGMGRVWDNQPIEDWWKFDPLEKSWGLSISFEGTNRAYGLELSANGKIYIACGLDKEGNYLSEVFSFNPLNTTWAQESSLPFEGIKGSMGFSIDNVLYLGTGITSSDTRIDNFFKLDLRQKERVEYEIYPNPTSGELNLQFINDQPTLIRIFTASGNLVKEINLTDSYQIDLNLEKLEDGMYILEIHTRFNGRLVERIVKVSE